jgi:hypothetical protein
MRLVAPRAQAATNTCRGAHPCRTVPRMLHNHVNMRASVCVCACVCVCVCARRQVHPCACAARACTYVCTHTRALTCTYADSHACQIQYPHIPQLEARISSPPHHHRPPSISPRAWQRSTATLGAGATAPAGSTTGAQRLTALRRRIIKTPQTFSSPKGQAPCSVACGARLPLLLSAGLRPGPRPSIHPESATCCARTTMGGRHASTQPPPLSPRKPQGLGPYKG